MDGFLVFIINHEEEITKNWREKIVWLRIRMSNGLMMQKLYGELPVQTALSH